MNRSANILTLLLAAQLLLVVLFFWPDGDEESNTAESALLSIDSQAIDRISISDASEAVVLSRDGQRWLMPEYHGLPVDSAKLGRLTNELPALSRGWPVVSSAGAAARFEVADDSFQRRIEFSGGGNAAATLYLGSSPGFRKVHTRIAGDDNVYAVEFNAFDVPAQAVEWLDKTLLQTSDMQFVNGLDYHLTLEGESWMGVDGKAPQQSEVDNLLNGLTSLRVTAAADIATATILDEMNAPPTIVVTTLDYELEYRLFEIGDAYYIQRADIPVFFSLSSFDYDRLNNVSSATLFPPTELDAPTSD